jgi:hypothetical protein
MGSIPGKPFADAFLACAIGPKPAPLVERLGIYAGRDPAVDGGTWCRVRLPYG